jgi:nucleotide-binding universal stress UspA family protein
MYRNILVPLDGSPFAEQAIPLAVNIARRAGGCVTLARVHVPLAPAFAHGMPPFDYELERGAREQAWHYVEALARQYAGPSATVCPLSLEGPVAESLCNCTQESHTDLVVVSTHGRGPMARFWLGSVADELVRKLTVPVLAFRPHEEAEPRRSPKLHHILIPLDGSELAESILEPAIALGSSADAEYTLLRVLAPPTAASAGVPELGGAFIDHELLRRLQQLEENERREAEQYLRATATRLSARALNVDTRLVTGDPAALTILAQARELEADAIALASHGRGGLARLLLGSVADKVLRGATMPVLLCHPTAADLAHGEHEVVSNGEGH